MAGAVWCRGDQSKFFLLCLAAGVEQSCEVADLVPAAQDSPQGCMYVHGHGLAGNECLVRVPCGHLLTELLRSAAPRGLSAVISSPRGACDSSLDGGVMIAVPRALPCFTSPSVLRPVAAVDVRAAGEVVMGGSLVQPEGSRGSPNPQLWLLDLAPLKSQHRAALFGTTQWCVSQFVSSAAFAKVFFFFSFRLFPSETCLWPSGFDRLLAPLPPPANDMVAETPALSPLPRALSLRF